MTTRLEKSKKTHVAISIPKQMREGTYSATYLRGVYRWWSVYSCDTDCIALVREWHGQRDAHEQRQRNHIPDGAQAAVRVYDA